MAERTKLTEKTLREAVPIVGRDYQIFDSELRGFAVCIYRGGGTGIYAGLSPRGTAAPDDLCALAGLVGVRSARAGQGNPAGHRCRG